MEHGGPARRPEEAAAGSGRLLALWLLWTALLLFLLAAGIAVV